MLHRWDRIHTGDSLTNQPLYNKLMNFIRKNRAIPDFLLLISQHEDLIAKTVSLRQAIEQGDGAAPIFNDAHCLPYLLYLLVEDKPIHDEQGLTALLFLMSKIKNNYQEIQVFDISKDKELSSNFIRQVALYGDDRGYAIDQVAFLREIETYSGTDAWLISIPPSQDEVEKQFLDQIYAGTLYFSAQINDRRLIPSVKMMNWLSRQLNPSPVQFYPIFGTINLGTLNKLHAALFHPLQLHGGQFVRNNLESAHDRQLSPLAILLHDIYHAYSGTLLTQQEHYFLYQFFLPCLNKICDMLRAKQNVEDEEALLVSYLNDVCYRLNDMDVGILASKENTQDHLFYQWLQKIFTITGIYISHTSTQNFSDLTDFYYAFYKAYSIESRENFLSNGVDMNLIMEFFERYNQRVALPIKNFILKNQHQSFPIPFNPTVIEIFCDQQQIAKGTPSLLDLFFNLLQECQTVSTLYEQLMQNKNRTLCLALMHAGFCYVLPGAIDLKQEDIVVMQQIIATKKHIASQKESSYWNQITLFSQSCVKNVIDWMQPAVEHSSKTSKK